MRHLQRAYALIVAVACVVATGCGATGPTAPATSATAASTPAAAPTTNAADVAATLQSWWEAVGDRASPGDWGPTDNSFVIHPTGLGIEQVHGNVLSSWSLIDGGSRLVVRWEREVIGSLPSYKRWGCQVGDEGVYTVHLAEGGARLTLGLESDPCTPRAVFLPGVWTRCSPLSSCHPELIASPPSSASDLESFWEADVDRELPADGRATDDWMNIETLSLRIEQVGGDVRSWWSLTDGGSRLVVRFDRDLSDIVPSRRWNCDMGAEGKYSVQLVQNGSMMTLGLLSDPCAPRAVFLPGLWRRSVCPPQGSYACAPPEASAGPLASAPPGS